MDKKTLVLGVSPNPLKYSHKAVKRLVEYGIEVHAIGKYATTVDTLEVKKEPYPIDNLHTVALYLNAENQKEYYDYILSLKPKRIIFNPGTDNEELEKLAKEQGIDIVDDCVLVMLRSGSY
jgi:uncharacterized protein